MQELAAKRKFRLIVDELMVDRDVLHKQFNAGALPLSTKNLIESKRAI